MSPLDATRMRGAHTVFIVASLVVMSGLVLASGATADDPSHGGLARALAVGFAAGSLAAFALSVDRGAGLSWPSTVQNVAILVALVPVLVLEERRYVEGALLLAGFAQLLVGLVRTARRPAIWPRLLDLRGALRTVGRSLPYLAASLALALASTTDLLVATVVEPATARGYLQVATAVPRTLLGAQALVAAVVLARYERRIRRGERRAWVELGGWTLLLGAGLSGLGGLALPTLASVFELPLARFETTAVIALCFTPIAMVAMTLLIHAIAVDRLRTILSMSAVIVVEAVALALGASRWGLSIYPLVMGVGSFALIVVAVRLIDRVARDESIVDGRFDSESS